jgi:hypothetical protein
MQDRLRLTAGAEGARGEDHRAAILHPAIPAATRKRPIGTGDPAPIDDDIRPNDVIEIFEREEVERNL